MTNYEAAPPVQSRAIGHKEFAAFLRLHPGEWYFAPFLANPHHLKSGRYQVFRPVGSWEARMSTRRLAVRYTGS